MSAASLEAAVKKFAHDLQDGPWENDLKQLGADLWTALDSDDEQAEAAAPADPAAPPAG